MAASLESTVRSEPLVFSPADPPLEPGDRLSREEFERRYEQMPHLKKAELIERTVYMPSPIRAKKHAEPHGQLGAWLVLYASETPGVSCFDNSTVRLDLDNEPQPDLVLMKTTEQGGKARISSDDYIEGSPELVVEIVGSSRAYDLHQKKDAYRRNGVCEYLAWITVENRFIWWRLVEGQYHEIAPDTDGLLKSGVFPGLWLDTGALLRGAMKETLAALRRGLDTPEHGAFIAAADSRSNT
ncbi:MAG: Uma2 family endonuclease [Verrucomicrobia bacterium]|nr:Uma2 family endonuclease [Verrucomicrobiota bacterium]